MSDDRVRDQYERYPYPPRDPADERRRLITGSPSHIDELNHHVFGGRCDFRLPFRALVAGGGTGDTAIMLAQQLADRGSPAEVVYVDVSATARAIAEARAEVRKLTNLRFHALSLLDLPKSGLAPFDYIDCCGVLHHLDDPLAGLRALAQVLGDGGGMGIMLYGELGRTGVYPMQQMLGMLARNDSPEVRIELTRRLLRQLPQTNWLRRNPFVRDHLEQGDAGLYDLLLHARDRAYRVPDIAALVAAAGLRVVAWIEPALYDPASYVRDPQILARLADLPWLHRCAFAELLAGNLRKHVFYAVRTANPLRPPDPADPRAVPVLRDVDVEALAGKAGAGSSLTASIDGITLRKPLPCHAGGILRGTDGRRSLREIHRHLRTTGTALDWPAFRTEFGQLYDALHSLGKLYLTFR
jgi:SAM-dependent methyltransferase